MEYDHIEAVLETHGDEIILGSSSWSSNDRSVKYAWRDSRGHRSRGGEVPLSAIPQMVRMIVEHEGVDHELVLAIAEGLKARQAAATF